MRVACLLIFLTLSRFVWAASPVLRAGEGFTSSDLAGYLARFDTNRAVSGAGLAGVRFRPVPETVVSYVADGQHHYLRFPVTNATPNAQSYVLHLQQHFFDIAEVLTFSAAGTLLRTQRSGWQIPITQRPLPDRLHAFRMNIPAGQTIWVVLHTKVAQEQGIGKVLLRFHSEAAFIQTNNNELFLQGGLFGCLILVCLLGVFLFAYTTQGVYGLYSVYILTLGIYILNVYGQFGMLTSHPGPLVEPGFGYCMLLLQLAFQGFFYLSYLRVDLLGAVWLHRWGVLWCGVITLAAMSYVFGISMHRLIHGTSGVGGILYAATMLACLGWGFYRKRSEAVWLSVSLAPMLAVLLYYVLAGRWLPVYQGPYTSLVIVPVLMFETVVLAVMLAFRFNADRRRALLLVGQVERESSRQVVVAQEEERQRLARDLHDDLGATLGLLRHELAGLQTNTKPLQTDQLNPSMYLITKSISDLRLIAHHLMPDQFTRLGLQKVLAEAVHWLAEIHAGTVTIEFVTYGTRHPLLLDVEINLYRIARELLNNALKHAHPQTIVVQLIYHPDSVYLSVEDDGGGYVVTTLTDTGMGLKNIRRRADYIGAQLLTESSPLGTLTTLTLPYEHTLTPTTPRADRR
ncbi:MAG: hypothetical protein EAZ91_06030 [Cytophagales bacterium]|nr:MAG: hypothetical protein EAZ91_06030 [Cytophagales bacterium]